MQEFNQMVVFPGPIYVSSPMQPGRDHAMLTSIRLGHSNLLGNKGNQYVLIQRLPVDAPVQGNRAHQAPRSRNVSPGEDVQAEKSKLAGPLHLSATRLSGLVDAEMG
jgi:hypothetical protein